MKHVFPRFPRPFAIERGEVLDFFEMWVEEGEVEGKGGCWRGEEEEDEEE
jgi:hypothetical protein